MIINIVLLTVNVTGKNNKYVSLDRLYKITCFYKYYYHYNLENFFTFVLVLFFRFTCKVFELTIVSDSNVLDIYGVILSSKDKELVTIIMFIIIL